MEQRRDWLQIWTALALVVTIIVLSTGAYFRWWEFRFNNGTFSFTHWMGWAGAAYLALFVPLYSVLKRRFKIQSPGMLAGHVFGNLIAFGMISVHFAQQFGPVGVTRVFGTGLAIYLIIVGIVMTGLTKHFNLAPQIQNNLGFIHRGLSLSLIIELPVHILRNL